MARAGLPRERRVSADAVLTAERHGVDRAGLAVVTILAARAALTVGAARRGLIRERPEAVLVKDALARLGVAEFIVIETQRELVARGGTELERDVGPQAFALDVVVVGLLGQGSPKSVHLRP